MTDRELDGVYETFGKDVRPRALTVTAVLWLFLGASWIGIGVLGLCNALWMTHMLGQFATHAGREGPSLPGVFWWYPGVAALLGAYGFKVARLALRLEERGRAGLRRVNIMAALLLGAFVLNWVNRVTTNTSYFGSYRIPPTADQVGMAIQGLIVGALCVAPFVYAAKKLNGVEVRSAMTAPTF